MTLSGSIGPGYRDLCGGARLVATAMLLVASAGMAQEKAVVNLPSSKELGAVPGNPQRVNSLPISMAVSPDGRYVVTVNAGYGTFESAYDQSLAVMDTQTGKVTDFPDARTGLTSKQTLYSGSGVQRGWEACVREHGFADGADCGQSVQSDEGRRRGAAGISGYGEGEHREWNCGVWVRGWEDCAGESDTDSVTEAGGGAADGVD
jgi:hypothetical protein